MARVDYWQYLLDRQGNYLADAPVRVYLAGTLTEADIYLDSSFGSVTKSSTGDLKTNQYGLVQFWVGDQWEIEGGYNVDQQFKIRWYNSVDSIWEEIDNFYVFTPVRPIVVTDSIKGVPSNRDKNKTISNEQGYNWDTHTDAELPLENPHGMAPATLYDRDTLASKVISNKLGYQMYQLATTASTITKIGVSGSRVHTETINTWTSSGGSYYKDVTHNFSNFYPMVKLIKNFNDNHYIPMEVKSISKDEVRIRVTENIVTRVVIFG
jgi:hypothetical protein